MLTKIGIKKQIFTYLNEKFKFTIINENCLEWRGKNGGWEFRFKEIPNWIFAIWISTLNNDNYRVDFFGEKECWIDKFKPGRCSIDSQTEMPKNEKLDEFSLTFELFSDIKTNLECLKRNRKFGEYILSNNYGHQSYLHWLCEDIYWYSIRIPFEKWYNKHIMPLIVKCIGKYWAFKYRKYLIMKDFIDNTEKSWPDFDLIFEYKSELNDEDYKVPYFGIEESKLGKWLRKHDCDIRHCEYNNLRGFYIEKEQ